MSSKRMRSCFSRKFRVVVALALVIGTLLGIVGGAAVTAFAASFPTVEYVGSDITKVTDLNSGVSKCSIDLGNALYEPGSCIAVPIDLSKYGTGTVQLRWYTTSAVQDQFSMVDV